MAAEFQVYTRNQRVVKDITAKIYLKDPLVEKVFPNLGKVDVVIQGESCIGAGPTSSRVAVVDYNGDLDTVFEAARLHSDKNASRYVEANWKRISIFIRSTSGPPSITH